MKKILLSLLLLLTASTTFADGEAKLAIHIADPAKTNKYFLCVYDVGCLSIKDGDKGITFPMSAMNVGNIQELVITDVTTMQEFMVPTNTSCNVSVQNGQKLSISGRLVVQNNKPTVKGLHCQVSA